MSKIEIYDVYINVVRPIGKSRNSFQQDFIFSTNDCWAFQLNSVPVWLTAPIYMVK